MPSILLKEHKAGYIEALAESQEAEDSRVFVEFMMGEMTGFLWRSVEEFCSWLNEARRSTYEDAASVYTFPLKPNIDWFLFTPGEMAMAAPAGC